VIGAPSLPTAAANRAPKEVTLMVKASLVSEKMPLEIRPPRTSPVGDATPLSYFVLVPAPPSLSGPCWTLLGERAKLVSVGRLRFPRIERAGCGLRATVAGTAKEQVHVLVLRSAGAGRPIDGVRETLDGEVASIACELRGDGKAQLSCMANECQCV
jgi:hypothetical protein